MSKPLVYLAIPIAIITFYSLSAPALSVFMINKSLSLTLPGNQSIALDPIIRGYYAPLYWLAERSNITIRLLQRYESWLAPILH